MYFNYKYINFKQFVYHLSFFDSICIMDVLKKWEPYEAQKSD